MQSINIQWDQDQPIEVAMFSTPPANKIYKMVQHLRHLALDFNVNLRDNPFSKYRTDIDFTYNEIVKYGKDVDVEIDINKLPQQIYLNYLHKIYEQQYNGERKWLIYHELIHIIERLHKGLGAEAICLDYREQVGMLTDNYDRSFVPYTTDKLFRGIIYMRWQELGKSPYEYFIDGEPDNFERICQLAKPWVLLKPNFYIAYQDSDRSNGQHLHSIGNKFDEFKQWFKQYKDDWKEYWNIPDWEPEEMFKVIPLGFISDMNIFEERLKNKNYPTHIEYV